MYAGVYEFFCATVLLLLLSPISNLLVEILSLPADFSALVLAGPVAFIGAVVWWAVVERRNGRTYLLGGAVGALTALLTVVFWVLVFVKVWGTSLVLSGWMLVSFVLGISVLVASVTGVPMMYARRRLDDTPSDGNALD